MRSFLSLESAVHDNGTRRPAGQGRPAPLSSDDRPTEGEFPVTGDRRDVEPVDAGSGAVASTLRALASPRRRVAIERLRRHRTVGLADLAELVAERESGEPVADLAPERVRRVYFSLYHGHVPALVDAGLARYDQSRDVVATTDRTTDALVAARDALDELIGE
jgi:hypothetical protein